jgi:hypothetical protein
MFQKGRSNEYKTKLVFFYNFDRKGWITTFKNIYTVLSRVGLDHLKKPESEGISRFLTTFGLGNGIGEPD